MSTRLANRSSRWLSALPYLLLTCVAGCGASGGSSGGVGGGGGAGGEGGGDEADIIMPSGTSALIVVQDPEGKPIPNASVVVLGEFEVEVDTQTDDQGLLLLENLKPGRTVAQVRASGFADADAVVDLESDQHGGAYVVMNPLGTPIDIDLSVESTVELGGVEVTIPANAMVDPLGNPVNGPGSVTIVPLDPTGAGLGGMPGPLEGRVDGEAQNVGLESVFMADISVWKDGQRLQLAEGKSATIRFPVPETLTETYKAGDVIDAWSFNMNKGLWEKEGHGVLEAAPDDPSKLTWVAQAPHFTWWNCDAYWGYQKMSCFNVTLGNGQGPLAYQWVTAMGLNYTGISMPRQTNAWGQTCVNVRASSNVRLYLGYTSNPYMVPATSNYTDWVSSSTQGNCFFPNTCQPISITIPPPQVCVPGSKRICPDASIPARGICRQGTQTCLPDGRAWTTCGGAVYPKPQETCGNWLDDNCNGVIDESCVNECNIGQTRSCYTGPQGTAGVGICRQGTQSCVQTPTGNRWSNTCAGEVKPYGFELCWNNTDDNCNGTQAECYCTVGQTRPCYTGPSGTQNVGACKSGVQTCQQICTGIGGSGWTAACVGQVTPQPAENCGTPVDDDCDGKTNNAPICCVTNADCGVVADACFNNVCQNGTCSKVNVAAGAQTPFQTPGDCMTTVCNGNGGTTTQSDPTDVDVDGNDCTKDVCGANPHPPEPAGTACTDNGGKVCDGGGNCVECVSSADCAGGAPCVSGKCMQACACNCSNQQKDFGETDVDCGGICPSKCGNTRSCVANSDCASGNCEAGICKAADCTNGKMDGLETDIDCGGIQCNQCPVGKGCLQNSDCDTQFCSPEGICK